MGPGQFEQKGRLLVHGAVLDSLQERGLGLLVAIAADHRLAEPAVGVAVLGEVLDGLAGERIGPIPILQLRRTGEGVGVAVPPLLVGQEGMWVRQQLEEQLQRLGVPLLLAKLVGLAEDRRVPGAKFVRHAVSLGADIARSPLPSSQQLPVASSHIAGPDVPRAALNTT